MALFSGCGYPVTGAMNSGGTLFESIVHQGPVGPEVTVEGKKYLYFGGSDYLGMSSREQVLAGARAAMERYGISSAASRISSGTNSLHLELESSIAAFSGERDAVVLSAGYLAMRCLVEGVVRRNDRILLQEDAHVSIRDAARLTGLPVVEYSIRDLDDLGGKARKTARAGGRLLVLGEGVSPLMGTIFPLDRALECLDGIESLVLLDDAHAFGVLGRRGRGTTEHFGLERGDSIHSCATLSKAFGSFGGCIPGPPELTSAVRERSMVYICATPPPAPVLGAALAAVRLAAERPRIIEKLRRNVALLRGGLNRIGIGVEDTPVPVVPLCLSDSAGVSKLSRSLLDSGIIAPLMSYPGSPAEGMLRIAVTAVHTETQIRRLIDTIGKFL